MKSINRVKSLTAKFAVRPGGWVDMSIKNKLALLVSLLFGVLLCIAGWALIEASDGRLQKSIVEENSALVRTLARSLDVQVRERHKVLIDVAAKVSRDNITAPEDLQKILENQFVLLKLFTNLIVYDKSGTVIAAWPDPKKYLGTKRLAGMEYVKHTLQSRQPYISDVFQSPVSGQPLIVMTAPVLDGEGNVIAIIGGSQYLLNDNLFTAFTETQIGEAGKLLLVSRDGTIIAHPEKSHLMTKYPPGINAAVDEALAKGHFAGESRTVGGVSVLMAIDSMATTRWLVGLAIPSSEAFEPIAAMRAQGILLLVVLLSILPLLVWSGASYLTRPLLLLRKHIKTMAQSSNGLARQMVLLDRRDEIGELAQAFNELTLARQHAEEAQSRLNRALRILSDCNQLLVHANDEKMLLQDICTLIFTHGGCCCARVGYVDEDAPELVAHMMAWAGSCADLSVERGSVFDIKAVGRTLNRMALQTGKTQVFQERNVDPMFMPGKNSNSDQPVGHGSAISMPLQNERGLFGVIDIFACESNAFRADEIGLLNELAANLSFGITTLRARRAKEDAESELTFLAHHDQLTGLPNRPWMREIAEKKLHSDRDGKAIAVAFIDIDNFKQVNDTYGHIVGDALLREVSRRLRANVRASDAVGRLGGDEFIVLLDGFDNRNEIQRICKRLSDTLRETTIIDDIEIASSASIGVAFYPEHGLTYDSLRKSADTAMYMSKASRKGELCVFDEEMGKKAEARRAIETEIRDGIRNERFRCALQSKVDLRTKKVVGFEALVRLIGDGGRLHAPDEFIPIAQECGLLDDITMLVLADVLRGIPLLEKMYGSQFHVSINVSAAQASNPLFMTSLAMQIGQSGKTERFMIEVTEDAFVSTGVFQSLVLPMLRKGGLKVSIDDFGTGYSCLSALADITADELKVDRSFVSRIHERPRSQSVLKSIESLGATLGMSIVAEGIETEEELNYLLTHTMIKIGQGYHFAKPAFIEDIINMKPKVTRRIGSR